MQTLKLTRGAAALGLALSLAACTESLSLDAAGDIAMTMQREGSSLFGQPSSQNETESRTVSPDTVSSFYVTVTSVQMLHASSDSSQGWTTVDLDAPVRIDLMALASSDDSARVFAAGRVEAGSYVRVRLVIANPTIRFKGNVSFGVGGILQGNTDYQVTLSNAPLGTLEIAADAQVEANASSQMHFVFDEGSTFGLVTIGSAGQVLLNAAISER